MLHCLLVQPHVDMAVTRWLFSGSWYVVSQLQILKNSDCNITVVQKSLYSSAMFRHKMLLENGIQITKGVAFAAGMYRTAFSFSKIISGTFF